MKIFMATIMLLYCALYFGSSLPYEPQISPPVEAHPFIYNRQSEPEKALAPPRREAPEEYLTIFEAAALSACIPPGVLESIAFVESGFDPVAMSPLRESGHCDLGMFQFNSAYLAWYAETYNAGIAFDPLSPGEAITVAAKHLRFLYDRYGYWPTVCLAYNAGMTAVDTDAIPDSSIRYLLKIYKNF
jgi:soluble lytic murein transglycosylase-like protein